LGAFEGCGDLVLCEHSQAAGFRAAFCGAVAARHLLALLASPSKLPQLQWSGTLHYSM
jgi:hypothetical protein